MQISYPCVGSNSLNRPPSIRRNICHYHRTAYANPAIKTSGASTHGGEVIANLANTMPIYFIILDRLSQYIEFPFKILFRSMLHHVEGSHGVVDCASLLGWRRLERKRNNHVLGQIDLLRKFTNMHGSR